MSKPDLICQTCGSANVQVCLPAWFDSDWNYVEPDSGAEPLTTFCLECNECRTLDSAAYAEQTGRWNL